MTTTTKILWGIVFILFFPIVYIQFSPNEYQVEQNFPENLHTASIKNDAVFKSSIQRTSLIWTEYVKSTKLSDDYTSDDVDNFMILYNKWLTLVAAVQKQPLGKRNIQRLNTETKKFLIEIDFYKSKDSIALFPKYEGLSNIGKELAWDIYWQKTRLQQHKVLYYFFSKVFVESNCRNLYEPIIQPFHQQVCQNTSYNVQLFLSNKINCSNNYEIQSITIDGKELNYDKKKHMTTYKTKTKKKGKQHYEVVFKVKNNLLNRTEIYKRTMELSVISSQ